MKFKKTLKSLAVISALLAASQVSATGWNSDNVYEVTVTNITKSIIFTPVMIAAHSEKIDFFEVGEAASAALERVAEGGDTGPIKAMFTGSADEVIETTGLLMAGQSSTVTFESSLQAPKFSLASMLLPTNDAFAAIESIKLPRGKNQKTVYVRAYDAGTEANDENCAHIPGGASCAGEAFSAEDASDEGFVYVHNGIHGIADLEASKYTWNNPVMKVTIKRITNQ
jgi:hypothetical protein